jgi:hypothetical protein
MAPGLKNDKKEQSVSHIVTIRTEVRNPTAIGLACKRLQLPPPRQGNFELFSGQATGWAVQLPDWRYPVVCQTDSGELKYDNFEGRWGQVVWLNKFLQMHAVEAAKLCARQMGRSSTEQTLPDGSIRLTIQVGGAA